MKQAYRFIRAWVRFVVDIFIRSDFVEFNYFPFRVDNPLPKSSLVCLKNCTGILHDLNVNYRITDGTVLGIYRQGEFISHDNDLDVDVLGDANWKEVIREFKALGFKLGRKIVYKGKHQQLVFYNAERVIFDIVIWSSERDRQIYNYSERGYVRSQSLSYFENMDSIVFHGKNYPVPTPIQEWLRMRYGPDWIVPKTYKGDWKEESFDISRMDSK